MEQGWLADHEIYNGPKPSYRCYVTRHLDCQPEGPEKGCTCRCHDPETGLTKRITDGIKQAENDQTADRGDCAQYLGDSNELCRCGHAALVHTDGAGNCAALGVTTQEGAHCLEFSPFVGEVKTIGEQIAYNIRAELVCCDIYGRVNDREELAEAAKNVLFKGLSESKDWHDLCYWGEASARLAERFR